MPDSNFRSQQKQAQHARGSSGFGLNIGLLALGTIIMVVGGQAVKHINENYEAIRNSSGVGSAALLGLAGAAMFFFGLFLMIRAFFKRPTALAPNAAAQHSAGSKEIDQRPSTGERVFFSSLGFVFGCSASSAMFLAAAARFIETEKAMAFSNNGFLFALFLALASLIIGAMGFFIRGLGLVRVPIYFLIGGGLTIAVYRLSGFNALLWKQFVDYFQ